MHLCHCHSQCWFGTVFSLSWWQDSFEVLDLLHSGNKTRSSPQPSLSTTAAIFNFTPFLCDMWLKFKSKVICHIVKQFVFICSTLCSWYHELLPDPCWFRKRIASKKGDYLTTAVDLRSCLEWIHSFAIFNCDFFFTTKIGCHTVTLPKKPLILDYLTLQAACSALLHYAPPQFKQSSVWNFTNIIDKHARK